MKTLQEMHQELDMYVDTPSIRKNSSDSMDVDVKINAADRSLDSLDDAPTAGAKVSAAAAAKCVDSGTKFLPKTAVETTPVKNKAHHHMRFKKPLLLKYRERSKSVGFDESSPVNETATPPASPPTPVAQQTWVNVISFLSVFFFKLLIHF